MPPPQPVRTAWSRVLGAHLRAARLHAGYTNAELADKLRTSPAKVSRMETGFRAGTPMDVLAFAAACGIYGPEAHRLVDLSMNSWDGYWVQSNGEPMPDELRSLIILETSATNIDSYQIQVIPGLLQTEAYIRALLREAGVDPDRLEPRVLARLRRQAVLDQWHAPQATYFIHECALWIMVGGPLVMAEQLRHLIDISSRGVCQVRIVPASAGGRPAALTGGAFTRLTHAESATVYVEHLTTSLFLDSPVDVEIYGQALNALDDCALTARQSEGMLSTLASRYEQRR